MVKEVYLGWLLEGRGVNALKPRWLHGGARADVVMHYDWGVSARRATYHSSFLPPSITDWGEERGRPVFHFDSSEFEACVFFPPLPVKENEKIILTVFLCK